MTQFNIHNSKVEQLNDSGDNYKVAGNVETNAISERGNVVQTTGRDNRVRVDEPKENFFSMLWDRVKACWKLIMG